MTQSYFVHQMQTPMDVLVARCSAFSGYKLKWRTESIAGTPCLVIEQPGDLSLNHNSNLTLCLGPGRTLHEVYGRLRHWAITPAEQETMIRVLEMATIAARVNGSIIYPIDHFGLEVWQLDVSSALNKDMVQVSVGGLKIPPAFLHILSPALLDIQLDHNKKRGNIVAMRTIKGELVWPHCTSETADCKGTGRIYHDPDSTTGKWIYCDCQAGKELYDADMMKGWKG